MKKLLACALFSTLISNSAFATIENCKRYPTIEEFSLNQNVTVKVLETIKILKDKQFTIKTDDFYELVSYVRNVSRGANRTLKAQTEMGYASLSFTNGILYSNVLNTGSSISYLHLKNIAGKLSDPADFYTVMSENDFLHFKCEPVFEYDITQKLDEQESGICAE